MKIGVTERGDPSIDLSWIEKMDSVDGAVLITKNLTDTVIEKSKPYFDKMKFHLTCTGYGGSIVEPHTPKPMMQLKQGLKLVKSGISDPLDRIVIRIDPIIPTEKGIQTAKDVFVLFASAGFRYFRVSVIDMYPHVRERFKSCKLPLPYGENGFAPSDAQLAAVNAMLANVKELFPNIVIQSCAEVKLTEADPVGCVSAKDAEQFGLGSDVTSGGYQRKGCLCCAAKTELLSEKKQCPYKCMYCYWK